MAKGNGVKRELKKIEKEEKVLEGLVRTNKAELDQILRKEKEIEKEETDTQKILFQIWRISVRKYHVHQVTKGFLGSFFGIVVSNFLFDFPKIIDIPWLNLIGVTLFLVVTSVAVLYNQEKRFIRKLGSFHLLRELIILYISAFVGIFFTLLFFNILPFTAEAFAKHIFIFLVPAIVGALTLTVL